MKTKKIEFSKKLIQDIRWLLWVVTIGGVLLAFYCVRLGYIGTLGWITALVGLPWSAHGVICSFYLNLARTEHMKGGITYDFAMLEYQNINNISVQENENIEDGDKI